MPTSRVDLLNEVLKETRRLFHVMENAAERLHGDLELTASQRAVLEALAGAPKTVPQIARRRGVSRQHIQSLANALTSAALIEAHDNPAHRRSPLLSLTPKGTRYFKKVQERERRILMDVARKLRLVELSATLQTLRTASLLLEPPNAGDRS